MSHRICIHVICDEDSCISNMITRECVIAHRESPNSAFIDSSQSLLSWEHERKAQSRADTLAGLLRDTFARLDEMRDAMLHSRGPMAESVEDSDQVNAVLGVFDDYYPSDIKTAFAALSDGDGERGGVL